MVQLRIMARGRQAKGEPGAVRQGEIEVARVVLLGPSGEIVADVVADDLVMLTAGNLPGSYVDVVRTARPNAYRPWTAEDDERAALVTGGAKAVDLVPVFDRRLGAIQSRVRKLRSRGKLG
ncbi:hypothetical protein LO762_10725 [Actinocorallia sp. API 0066]|uniref:hypothetical protein n=1 Tax=Actinocorallia sp. API 0066 TaxID=2896846 RepID=UPI001E62845A|nr:hypothetical protein [Actinocorallia sp. API 0066]MCD0449659.1 hypothetical protein [Actinocorallia sp. API 0066]